MPTMWLGALDHLSQRRPMRWIAFGFRELANFLIPTSCAVCSRADFRLCPECRSEIQRQLFLPPLPDGQHHYVELPLLAQQLPVSSCGIYGKELARSMLAFKNKQRYFLGAVFAPYLAAAINSSCIPQPGQLETYIVPVPSSLKATGKRGYSPVSSMLARGMRRGLYSADLAIKPVLHYRVRSILAGAQKLKSGSARRSGKEHFIAEQADTPGRPVILVDDVLTTGSTLRQAAMACHEAGYNVTLGIVLALTKPPNHESEQ
ncbi:hypothetical protein NMP99_10730 [Glutamicibacter mishrai]|uniref:ComF family protein n=1 Tax=Glutamicibacter mishrai TaxID=1775880 RepID=UPI0020CC7C75|nr:hypothetical protein [Glutamicibacter mishrai]UTT38525.1 hypothetical protein NMP99_10730 [Glutamicibacter mishrai]